MPWIVVLESDGRLAESIREGLVGDGWQVAVAASRQAAQEAIERHSPQLVIVGLETEGAAESLAAIARTEGGPGTVALVPEGGESRDADATISRTCSANELRLLVRQLATSGRATRAALPDDDGERLTSQDLFGDVLAEVEAEQETEKPAPQVKRAHPPSALDERLSGLLQSQDKPRAAPTRRTEPNVDDLLSKTLSGLDVGARGGVSPPRPPVAATPKPSAATPSPPAARTPPPHTPATPTKGRDKEKPAAKPLDRLLESVKPIRADAPARRPSREVDLSSLDELVRRQPEATREKRDRTPTSSDPLATQKIAVPPALRPSAGPVEFGQYTLLERIALGGMAEVWKARMKGVEGFQKTVAIKKILPHLTDSTDFVTMFIDEAKLAAQLNHNNIIHIYDLGKIGDDFYIAMEYVDGKDLRTILNAAREQKRPLLLGLALLVASRVAAALDHAHHKKDFEGRELGLVHRDVSPQNVLISFEGDIKLCDFGIVKAVSKASKTQMGALKGKLQYMSPEQAWGRPVDARSDIFSLGSLLFEMLTGRRLFTGESEMSVLDAVREGRIQAPRDLDPRVPLEVNALVLHALAREPKDRFRSAGEFQREIESILESLRPAPTQRDLATYLRELFDGGTQNAAAAPVASAAQASASPAIPPHPTPAVPAREEVVAIAPSPGATTGGDAALDSAPGGRKLVWIGLAAAVVAAVIGFFVLRGGDKPATAPAAPETATGTSDAPAAAPESSQVPPSVAGVSNETPAAATAATQNAAAQPDVAEMVDSAVKKREEQLREQLDAELAKKKKELEAAQAREAAAPPAVTAAATKSDTPAAAAASGPVTAPKAQDKTVAPAVAKPATTSTPAPPPAEARSDAPTGEPASPPIAPATAAPPKVTTPTPAPAPAAETRKAPSVREGDLVEPGPGFTAPVLVSVDKPEYPPIARRMRVEGTVVLSLLVDENGRVIDVRLERGVSQNVGINEAAIAAAKSARFRPATKDGVRVKTWHQLTIPFKL